MTPPLLLAEFENPKIQKSTRVAPVKNRFNITPPNFSYILPPHPVELAFCREYTDIPMKTQNPKTQKSTRVAPDKYRSNGKVSAGHLRVHSRIRSASRSSDPSHGLLRWEIPLNGRGLR